MDDEAIAGEVNLDTGIQYDPAEQPPEYLVSLFIALDQLTEVRKDILVSDLAEKKARYASIAITDLEKLIAFVSLYLSSND